MLQIILPQLYRKPRPSSWPPPRHTLGAFHRELLRAGTDQELFPEQQDGFWLGWQLPQLLVLFSGRLLIGSEIQAFLNGVQTRTSEIRIDQQRQIVQMPDEMRMPWRGYRRMCQDQVSDHNPFRFGPSR